jgi:hypothetical protein
MEPIHEDDNVGMTSAHHHHHDDDNVDDEETFIVLRDRLNKVRKAVHKATQDAWKQASGYVPSSDRLQKENASFLLGMDLFGTGSGGGGGDHNGGGGSFFPSNELERTVRDKLDEVERELQKIQHLESSRRQQQPPPKQTHSDDVTDEYEYEYDDDQENVLASQIRDHKNKIAFLKRASMARSRLEESKAIASPALTSEPDLVQASQRLLQATKDVDDAEGIILRSETAFNNNNNNNINTNNIRRDDNENDTSTGRARGAPIQDVQVAYQIVSSLRHQIRKHRVELVHKASTVLDTSLEMTGRAIAIKSTEQLSVAYQVLETLHVRQGGNNHNSTSNNKDASGPAPNSALQDALKNFTTRLYQDILKPILLERNLSRPWNVEETSDKRTTSTVMIGVTTNASKKGTVHRIEWSPNEDQDDDNDDDGTSLLSNQSAVVGGSLDGQLVAWRNILTLVQRILAFVQSKVLLERDELCTIVGTKLFGKPNAMPSALNLSALGLESALLSENDQGVLMENLVDWLQDNCLQQQKNEHGIDDLERVTTMQEGLLECTIPFCNDMMNRHLIPHEEHQPKLLSFCHDFEKAYVDQRRCVLLNTARDILISNDYHNTVAVGVEENTSPKDLQEAALTVFQLSRCSISDTAHRLMTLIRQTMDEAVTVATVPEDSSLSLLRPTLYRTAREMLSLFRAIIPSTHGREVAHVPRTAAVLHNDAVFLAHHCLTLGLEYKEKFPPVDEGDARGKLVKQTCIFVDMVPLFRELADTSLGDMLELQKHQLADIVGSRITYFGRSLQSDESLHEWSEAETALAAGIYHLRHLAQSWRPILAPSVFLRSMGYLADVVFALYLGQVTAASDISVNACQFTCSIFHKALNDIGGLLQTSKDDKVKYSSEWAHFEAVGKFLELNHLSEVERALSLGVFRHVASQDLARLVRATYGESSQRRALLNVLSSVV